MLNEDEADSVVIDFETRAILDLRRVGMYRYAEHVHTAPWVLSALFLRARQPLGTVARWHPGDTDPVRLLEHVRTGRCVVAHNAGFERLIWNTTLRRRPAWRHWPEMTIAQMDCTMARALAIHLPAELDALCQVLGLTTGKSKEAAALMRRMMRPRGSSDGEPIWWDDPDMIDRLGRERCNQDVLDETAVDAALPALSAAERRVWELDQHINDRGVAVDVPMVRRCVAVLDVAQERAAIRMRALTRGAVQKCSEAARIGAWLRERGIPCESIAKDEHDDLKARARVLGDDAAGEVVALRAEAARNSTAKFRRMLDVVCDDGRLHGTTQYHRALTGRWGGALIQPHNMPRVDPDRELPDVLTALEIMEQHVP